MTKERVRLNKVKALYHLSFMTAVVFWNDTEIVNLGALKSSKIRIAPDHYFDLTIFLPVFMF